MKMLQTADYLIYFDNVRVDHYIVSWNTVHGLMAGQASGSITIFKSPAMQAWKAYLTQVRIFAKNVFSGKYTMVFEGEITDRSWSDKRVDPGKVVFQISGFHHWLEVPVPLIISNNDSLQTLKMFEYEAQGINARALTTLFKTQDELSMRNKNVAEVIGYLFDRLNQGYYEAADTNSAFAWANLRDRFKVMVDIMPKYRSGGFLDIFTFISSTQINSFYVYLNDILSQMMFEFYQDRDGTFRIKNPSWGEPILKNHVIDESMVIEIDGMDAWSQEPTRVLAIGGIADIYTAAQRQGQGGAQLDYLRSDITPVGLYIADGQKYFSADLENVRRRFGLTAGDFSAIGGGVISTDTWFDNLTGQYTITSPFTGSVPRTDVPGMNTSHKGTDYGVPNGTIVRNIGTSGTVASRFYDTGGGNILIVSETINGTPYEFRYMHLSEYLVSVGDSVSPGQTIARSGGQDGAPGAGSSTGPHLHLGIYDMSTSTPIDPDAFLRKANEAIQTSKAGTGTNGSASVTGNVDSQKLISSVSSFSSVIVSAASAFGIDLDLAKIFLAVNYASDSRDSSVKNLDYNSSPAVRTMLRPLSGVSISNADAIRSALKGTMNASQIEQITTAAYQLHYGDKQSSSSTKATSYNAYSTTDGLSNPFMSSNLTKAMFDPVGTLERNKQPNSTPPQTTAWADFEATAYIATCPGCTGFTRTGLDVRDISKEYSVIAVDPSVIPLYSLVEIQGPSGVSGVYNALDTGGAIKGHHIDILMNSYTKAMNFGRVPLKLRILRYGKGDDSETSIKNLRPVSYAATNTLNYPIPSSASDYATYIKSAPNGVDPNMISAIIDATSSWQPKYSAMQRVILQSDHVGDSRLGLMSIPQSYRSTVEQLSGVIDWYDPLRSIEFGTKFFAYCMSVLQSKPTLALAAYFIGDPITINGIARTTNTYEYTKLREALGKLSPSVAEFVEHTLDIYLTALHGDYVNGDPHKNFGTLYIGGRSVDAITATNTAVGSFENSFAVELSEEEKRFKMFLRIAEQKLIRYDSKIVQADARKTVDELIKKYAKYVMQLTRAAAHVVTVSLGTCNPFLRPGFNTWIEPSRNNVVAYITSVAHQGVYAQGCYTTFQSEFVRTPATYDDLEKDLFIGERYAKVEDFGEVVTKGEMSALRQKLIDLNDASDETVDDAYNVSVLRSLYASSMPSTEQQKYVSKWNAEYTKDEIDTIIQSLYSGAPPVIKERIKELKRVISDSEDFFINKLLAEFSS